jgi:hydroxyacyl-ACP dehydratase HTD2-like protein with hotdog domain
MWAGGRIRQNSVPLLHNSLGVCLERIRDVAIKGAPGEEKAVVSIERRISTRRGLAKYLGYPELRWELSKSGPVAADGLMENHLQDDAQCDIIEHRDLVFLRADHGLGKKVSRTVKMPRVPTFSHMLTPTAALLFRFSALTFNAHRIHLDREYCREVEGHRNLLVHGPLSVVLMLAILRKHLLASGKREAIQEFEYRNLAPLYAEEEMRVCIYDGRPGHHDVWIEGPDGGLAVKGTAKTAVATEGGKRGVC